MKKISLLLLTAMIATVSCTKETESVNETADLTQQLAVEDTNIGIYKGVLSTLNSESRASFVVTIPDASNATLKNHQPSTVVTFENGTTITLEADALQYNKTSSTVIFQNDQMSLTFSVEEDGSNPTVSNVTYNNLPSSAIVAKETSRAPVTPLTGTYVCENCGAHPTLGTGAEQSFNNLVITPVDDEPATVMTDIVLGSNSFNGTATQQDCNTIGNFTSCAITTGTINTPGTAATFTGSQTYNNEATGANDCSDVSGDWEWVTTNFGTLSGTFQSNEICVTPAQPLYEEDFLGFRGQGLSPDKIVAGTLDSNVIKITGLGSGTTDMDFGETRTSDDHNKYARSSKLWNIDDLMNKPGVYDLRTDTGVDPNVVKNRRLGFQPKGGTFNAGFVTIRVQNTSGVALNEVTVSYDLLSLNSGNGSARFNSFYSTDDNAYTNINSLNYSTTQAGDTTPVIESNTMTETISVSVPVDGFFYLQFKCSNDNSSGNSDSADQDQVALDNIVITGGF